MTRFGLMHCISSSLCFWVWTIIRETLESMIKYDDDDDEKEKIQRLPTKTISETSFFDDLRGQPVALALSQYGKLGTDELRAYIGQTPRVFTKGCEGDQGLRLIYQNFSPYLYPFSVEYSILVGKLHDFVHH